MSQYVLGIGCDRSTSLATLNELVDLALKKTGISAPAVTSLATIDKKKDEPALLELSQTRGWPLVFFSAAQLAQVEVPNPSAVVLKYMGTPAVSEAAALLCAQTGQENLILEKLKYKGQDQKNATLSIVRIQDA